MERITSPSCSRVRGPSPGARNDRRGAGQSVSRGIIMPSAPAPVQAGSGNWVDVLCGRTARPAPGNCSRTRQSRWFSATMGTMSASDAAPLPRLGEVFFDVRGNSRSMRLSWYADTGVAVFSIWQGGMCTGTFRLPIADLPRMVQTLQRGPDGQHPGWDGEAPGQAFADAPGDATAQVRAMGPMSGQMMQPASADFRDDGPGSPDQGRYRNGT